MYTQYFYNRLYATALSVIILLTGCKDGVEDIITGETAPQGYNVEISVPADEISLSRAATSTQVNENNVERLDVLFFKKKSENVYEFEKRETANNFIYTNGKYMANMETPFDGTNADYMILAFANADNNAGFEDIQPGESISQVVKKIKFTAGAMPVSAFPMATNTLNVENITSKNHYLNLGLERSVARIDIDATSVSENFTLLTAEIRNARSKGYMSKDFDDETNTHIPTDGNTVTDYISENTDDRDTETVEEEGVIKKNKITGKLFAPENGSWGNTQVNKEENTCVIIGGIYKNPETQTIRHTYYRIDIGNKDGSGQLNFMVKRNRRYMINITEVNGVEADSKDEAEKTFPKNLHFDISEWDNTGSGGVAYNGNQLMAVERWLIKTGPKSKNQIFQPVIKTKNIKFENISLKRPTPEPDWVSVSNPVETENGAYVEVKILKDLEDGQPERNAYYTISSGGLKLPVAVRQTKEENAMITLNINKVDIPFDGFPSKTESTSTGQTYPAEGQKITFNISGISKPESATWTVKPKDGHEDWLGVEKTNGTPIEDNMPLSGNKEFCITAKRLQTTGHDAPGFNRKGFLNLEITSNGIVYKKIIEITQYTTPLTAYFTKNAKKMQSCLLSGKAKSSVSFNVSATCSWMMETIPLFKNNTIDSIVFDGRTYRNGEIINGSNKTATMTIYAKNINNPNFWETTMRITNPNTNATLYEAKIFQTTNNKKMNGVAHSMLTNEVTAYNKKLVTVFTLNTGESEFHPNSERRYYWGYDTPLWGTNTSDRYAWNAGSEESPRKGKNDPCPEGWRTMTKKEYQELIAARAFSDAAGDSDVNIQLKQFYHTINLEWTSYNDGEKLCYFDWRDKTLKEIEISKATKAAVRCTRILPNEENR